jgi:hypothetical protein
MAGVRERHMNTFPRQRTRDFTIEEMLETFSFGSVPMLCKENQLELLGSEKTNPSSYRRGGPLPNCVGVKCENKSMVTGPDGALLQE